MERNYVEKKFFDFAAYEQLVNVINNATAADDAETATDAREDLEFVRKSLDNCVDYVHAVDLAEIRIKTARFRCDPDEYRDIVATLDYSRRQIHEGAIASVAILNRVARAYGCDKIFCGDAEDRLQVADFCLEVSVEIFNNRKI